MSQYIFCLEHRIDIRKTSCEKIAEAIKLHMEDPTDMTYKNTFKLENFNCANLMGICSEYNIRYQKMKKKDMCEAIELHQKDPSNMTYKNSFRCKRCRRMFSTEATLEGHSWWCCKW